jgi:hypothetical protein
MNRRELLKSAILVPFLGLVGESSIKYSLWYRDDYFCYVLFAEKEINGCCYEVYELIDNPTKERIAKSKASMVKKFKHKEKMINGGHWYEQA